MNWRQFNWMISTVVVVVTIALLTGGQVLWQRYAVAGPLDKMFLSIEGVEKVAFEDSSRKDAAVKINITLGTVSNLEKTYQQLLEGGRNILGNKPFKLVLHDSRTPELEDFYYNIHYYVQEAIFNGNFATMAQRIQEKAEDSGITAKVYVDTKYVYLQMSKENANMYVVVPRQADSGR